MITSKQENLTDQSEKEVRQMLRSSAFAIFKKVIESKAKTGIAKATGTALETVEFPAKLNQTDAEFKSAHRYKICLDVLDEISSQTSPLTTVKLS